jgi:hypothetical protein
MPYAPAATPNVMMLSNQMARRKPVTIQLERPTTIGERIRVPAQTKSTATASKINTNNSALFGE